MAAAGEARQQRYEFSDPPSIRPRVSDHQAGHGSPRSPSQPAGDGGRQSGLLVQLHEHPPRVVDAGLQLAHEKRAREGVIGEVVDAASLAVLAVRHLWAGLPSVRSGNLQD